MDERLTAMFQALGLGRLVGRHGPSPTGTSPSPTGRRRRRTRSPAQRRRPPKSRMFRPAEVDTGRSHVSVRLTSGDLEGLGLVFLTFLTLAVCSALILPLLRSGMHTVVGFTAAEAMSIPECTPPQLPAADTMPEVTDPDGLANGVVRLPMVTGLDGVTRSPVSWLPMVTGLDGVSRPLVRFVGWEPHPEDPPNVDTLLSRDRYLLYTLHGYNRGIASTRPS